MNKSALTHMECTGPLRNAFKAQAFIFCFLLLLILPGAGYSATGEKVTIQLKWFHQFQFAGYYAALEKGFYADEGLDVELRQRDLSTSHIDDVLQGRAQYGTADAGLLLPRLQGKPVVLLAQIFQHSPLVFLTLRDSEIETPQEMAGKRVSLDIQGHTNAPLIALLLGAFENLDAIKPVKNRGESQDLIDGTVDAHAAYVTNQPYWFSHQDTAVNIIDPRDYGIDFYGDNLFTTEEELRDHPERVERLRRATLKGWHYALNNREEIIELILKKYNPQKKSRDFLAYEARETEKLILPHLIEMGTFDSTRYQTIANTYVNSGFIQNSNLDSGFFYKTNAVQPRIQLTAQEQAWIATHPQFKVGAFDIPPYIMEEDGQVSGYFTELLQAVSRQVGLKPEFHFASLQEVVNQIQQEKLDATMGLIHTSEREQQFHLSKETYSITLNIFAHQERDDINDIESLAGKTLASYDGYTLNSLFKKYLPDTQVIKAADVGGMFHLVATGEADAAVQEFYSGESLLRRQLISNIKEKGIVTFGGKETYQGHYYGVGKKSSILATILDKSHRVLPEAEKQRIWNRWFAKSETSLGKVYLTPDEQAYLNSTSFHRQPFYKWMPFNMKDENGKIIGLGEDYWSLIRQKLGLKEIEGDPEPDFTEGLAAMQQGKTDIISSTTATRGRESYALFSNNYIDFPIAIANRQGAGAIFSATALEGKVVSVGRNYSAYNMLKARYPDIKFLQVANTTEALKQVINGNADAAVDILPALQYHIDFFEAGTVKVAGVTDIRFPVQVMVRKEHARLVPLINRAIAAITPQEHNIIQQKWMMREVISEPDYTLLWQVLGTVLLILAIILYWNRRLRREITERKHAEERLQQSSIVVEKSPVVLFRWKTTDSWPVDYVSSNVIQFGYAADSLISGETSYSSIVHPDDLERITREVQEYSNSDVEQFTQEYRIISPTGKVYWIDDRTSIGRDTDGNISYYQGVVIDVTESKLAEKQYRSLFEGTGTAMAVLEADGSLSLLNHTFAQLADANKNELIGHSIWEWVAEADRERLRKYHRARLHGDENIPKNYEFRFRNTKGREGVALANLTFFPESGRTLISLIDVTESKRAEREKENLKNELQHSQKMESLGHLTGGIAHEFNNLLGIINGYTELAATKCINKGDEDLLQYIRSIETAGGRAASLVAEMLDFGRSKQTNDLPLDLSSIIVKDVEMLRSTLPSSIEIDTKIEPQLPGVLMNQTQLNQILMNLFINARDAMDGVGKLTVQLHMRHGLDTQDSVSHRTIKGDWIELSVSDTGTGIQPEIEKDIFTPFFTTKDVGKGTGMGLSIIYRIMEDHAGHIVFDSEPEKGTTFRLLFPPIEHNNNESDNLTEESSEIPKGDGSEILVVDDEEMLATHMSEVLQAYGYKPHYVVDSIDALNLFREDPDRFSVVITDQTMPKLTGKELVKNLRAIRPGVPVIMCSGYSDKINYDEATKLNISYFSKPVDINDIMKEVSNLLVLNN